MAASNGVTDSTIPIFLITGFLGSGKTTFLNCLIKSVPPGTRLAVLMNEFGEIGIDGALIPGEDFDLLEINNGSIFCICVKKDFLTGLQKIVTEIRPDVLIMESTGVANPADLARDLQLPLFRNRLKLEEQFCVVDAACFEEAYGVFASVEKQLETSTVFILNKVDVATGEQVKRVRELIERHHPNPVVVETTYCDGVADRILASFSRAGADPARREDSASPGEPAAAEDLDAVISRILEDPQRQITPPDRLVSAVFRWSGSRIEDFRALMAAIPPGVIRGKGFLEADGKTFLFNRVMGTATVEEAPLPSKRTGLVNRLCFIMPPDTLQKFDELLGRFPTLSPDKPTKP
ncbi:MAG: CobW family GTP-binding protein [Syntrophobacteraceae bacterium]|nr:CobW family GTP-binding protein [Desulfobacteraceae bacterium]